MMKPRVTASSCPACGETLSFIQEGKQGDSLRQVVVVDDELGIQDLLMTALSGRYAVAAAATLGEALHLIHDKRPQLVFLDLRLPDGNGLDLLKRIKKESPQTVVVMITAYGDEKSALTAMKRGAAAFVAKPFSVSYIRQLVDNLFEG